MAAAWAAVALWAADITVIALWLGHESPATTHQYVEADLVMKERALRSLQPPDTPLLRYRPSDRVLEFLQGLQSCAVRIGRGTPATAQKAR